MQTYQIAAIGGDGIGPEVLECGLRWLHAVAEFQGFRIAVEHFPWGSNYYRQYGEMMPGDALETLKEFDAIYFGAVGDPEIPDDVTLWGLRIAICQGFGLYANVRPALKFPGLRSPLRPDLANQINWIVVRENSEGEYAGIGGRSHQGFAHEIAVDAAVFSRVGIERVQRFAFEACRSRSRKHLTCVTKSNAQRFGMVLWDEIFDGLSKEYTDVETDKVLVDAATARMVLAPASLDVVVASNLHGDILSDLAAALTGSLGIAPSANLDPSRTNPSMFEPVHGSAPDIIEKGIANPIATIWSGAMLCEHLGEYKAASRVMTAITKIAKSNQILTRDLGGSASTEAVTEAIIRLIGLDDLDIGGARGE